MNSNDKLALVTGASRGIGAAIAHALAHSYELLLGGRDRDALLKLTEELPSASPWPVELTDFEAVAKAVVRIDRLDALVHNAGTWEAGLIGETSSDTWQELFDVNLFAVAELTKLLLPALRTARGHVVLINSTAGMRASPGRGVYAASKFALRAFGEALHAEEAANGVRVTSIYPGRVATDLQRKVCVYERGVYRPDEYIAPISVAHAVLAALKAPIDSELTEIVIARTRPSARRGVRADVQGPPY
jgi:NADP-dependent 3-hydroxy acid dehydrogenase YdfG